MKLFDRIAGYLWVVAAIGALACIPSWYPILYALGLGLGILLFCVISWLISLLF